MSWRPFRKQPKKTTTELVPDNEFDTQVDKFNKVEKNTTKLYKDTKRFLENNVNLIKTEQRFCQELAVSSHFVENDQGLNETLEYMQQALSKQTEHQSILNTNLKSTVNDPLKKFSANFTSVTNAIKRREQSLQDYSKYINRRERLSDKEGQSAKFDANERYLALAKADFDRRNNKLLEELPKFHECRLTYFAPCFETLVKSQYMYFKHSRDVLEELATNVDSPTEQWSDEEYRQETKKRLSELKALTITVD